jgi:threonine/homoserine/homoserine lactone efflux protein
MTAVPGKRGAGRAGEPAGGVCAAGVGAEPCQIDAPAFVRWTRSIFRYRPVVPTMSTVLVVAGASLLLAVVPGPAVMFIVTRSLEHGRAAGLTSASGVAVGSLVHVVFAGLGLSVVLARSAAAFSAVKVAGAGYLVVMGLRKLLARRHAGADPSAVRATRHSPRRVFANGFVVSLLNPKVALFFLAFLPQFVDPRRGRAAPQLLVLGLTFVAIALSSDCVYAVTASAAAARLRRRFSRSSMLERASGAVYVGLGIVAALARRPVTSPASSR